MIHHPRIKLMRRGPAPSLVAKQDLRATRRSTTREVPEYSGKPEQGAKKLEARRKLVRFKITLAFHWEVSPAVIAKR
jgi:hypothetical protein